jgi:hypothetical protein
MSSEKKIIDWETLSVHYRAGIRSLKDMGLQFGVSDAAIIKKARKEGWTRDLKGKIKAKADKLVSVAMVSAEVSAQTKVTEKLTIEVEAQVRSRIILSHRQDIPAARKLVSKLFKELELQTDGIELLRELGEIMREPNESGQDKRNDLYNKVISLSGRSTTLKSLVDSLKVMIALEREAFGLDDDGKSSDESEPTMSDAELAVRIASLMEDANG